MKQFLPFLTKYCCCYHKVGTMNEIEICCFDKQEHCIAHFYISHHTASILHAMGTKSIMVSKEGLIQLQKNSKQSEGTD